ncbi:hypothetical protein EJ04DRAFT_515956 [Polyplosphaeria fusca]|uniref:Cell division cycle protein 123 n=1 Tax=Polyplosphaeria fusca TaxID=682080 RepID=A0A9P4QPL3_9PLEO|nr:hypothetical protein EJ04DRAFT_515956 [Polyplosphaeria fusca]
MKLLKIPYSIIAVDKAKIEATKDTSHPSSRSRRFNTAHHTHAEISPVVPEKGSFEHSAPPWTPYGYANLQPLVVRSQNIAPLDCYIGTIPSYLWEDLLRVHAAWLATGKIHNSVLNDTVESWMASGAGKEIAKYLDGERKWFIRLDQMSPKDSPLSGNLPCTTMHDVVSKIGSSMRAHGCLQREKEDAERECRHVSIKLILNRWNEQIDAGQEFRVFVPPPAACGGDAFEISAISQYQWHSPFEARYGLSVEETLETVHAGAKKLLAEIEQFVKGETNDGSCIWELLVKHGLTFDLWLKGPDDARLIEINPFGALSGCGACLFNWVLDGRTLYGLDESVFALTLEEDGTEE